nr:uncharacterized abhydrolase domain-containing protein DDB_G0269086-like [Aegilops tauschii subsp. strangulata]
MRVTGPCGGPHAPSAHARGFIAASPIALARAAAEAATAEGAVFRRCRSDLADQAEAEGRADSDLGLDPNDAEALAWRDRNRAEAELEAASVHAWTDAAAAWARPGAEPVWREMPEGTVVAATVFEPSSVRERGRGGRAEVVIPDRGVVEVEDDTPRRGPTWPSERGLMHLDAFRVAAYNRLLGKHRELVERLAAKEEELCIAASEVLSWRTRLLRASHHYDWIVADTGRLGAEAAQARAEAAAARRSLNEANRLHEQLAGHKSRLEAEVELLKAEAAKVAEAQQALVEDQQRGRLADDKGRLQAEALEERDRASERERRGTLLEAQHLEESFSRAFSETQRLAEEAVHYQRDPTDVVGSGMDPRVAWTFPEIIAAAEARLQVLGKQLGGCPRPAPR